MKLIPLTKGLTASVDDEDYEKLLPYKWYAWKHPKVSTYYARARIYGKTVMSMHVFLMGTRPGLEIDHKNGNGLDNQRSENLRWVTHMQNSWNQAVRSNNISGHRGISWDSATGKWRVRMGINYKTVRLPRFSNLQDAIQAKKEAWNRLYGEFARSDERRQANIVG